METLELKHLAPYLPYDLTFVRNGTCYTMNGLVDGSVKSLECEYEWFPFVGIKPILRPMSDLRNSFKHHGRIVVPNDEIFIYASRGAYGMRVLKNIHDFSFNETQKLFEWHFDVLKLIDYDLAFDINKIEE